MENFLSLEKESMANNAYGLTNGQIKFANEWLIDFNATRAAIAAGYSENTATEQGSRLLTNVKVMEYLADKQSKLAIKHNMTLDIVVSEYKKIALFDIRKCFDENGDLIPIHELDDDTAGGIAGIEVYEEKGSGEEETFTSAKTKKIKISDKRAALDSICKVLGYNAPEKSDVTNNIIWQETKTYKAK